MGFIKVSTSLHITFCQGGYSSTGPADPQPSDGGMSGYQMQAYTVAITNLLSWLEIFHFIHMLTRVTTWLGVISSTMTTSSRWSNTRGRQWSCEPSFINSRWLETAGMRVTCKNESWMVYTLHKLILIPEYTIWIIQFNSIRKLYGCNGVLWQSWHYQIVMAALAGALLLYVFMIC